MEARTRTPAQTPAHHQCVVDFNEPVTFTFDGKTYTGYAGDTIASALYRGGVRIFSRSFKYHRPRGLMCVDGSCPNCLVDVDGAPNVRSCTTPLEPGARVRSQNAWPSLDTDLMGVFDTFSALLPVGFYYKLFIRPRRLWPLYETVLRHAAGLGEIDPHPEGFETPYYDKRYMQTDVAVVGGGPVGLSAALEAANVGARVTLVDQNPQLGGHLRYARSVSQVLDELVSAVCAHLKIEVLTNATAFGRYQGDLIGIALGNRLIKLRTRQLIVAAGRIEQPLVFPNNDLPGVMLGSGVQRLMHLYGITPGERALVVTNNDSGWQVARDLLAAGVEVAAVADSRPEIPGVDAAGELESAGVPVRAGHTIMKATGMKMARGAVIARLTEEGKPIPGTETRVDCDLIVISAGFRANNALLYQSESKLRYDPDLGNFVPESYGPTVLGGGHAIGSDGLERILLEGRLAGMQAGLRVVPGQSEYAREQLDSAHSQLVALRQASLQDRQGSKPNTPPPPILPGSSKKDFVCFCEDVTVKDLQDTIGEGFEDIETLKRYSTISMGPCQGKMCLFNSIRLCARETGRSVAETGVTTSRPPFEPVRIGVLAGRKLEPTRLTPMHDRHLALNARMMNAGQWKRPETYIDPYAEVRAVRQQVGIIDVSTLGKIDMRGPDAVRFLETVYTGKFRDLKVGRIRYGLLCTEEGIIFDDGIVCRLAEDHFYLTTSSGGSTSIYEWLTWWLASWNLQVHVSQQSSAYATVNVAGPHARDLLSSLTDVDLSNEHLPYMHFRMAQVAGVPARLLRIGFVGELSYEIHFPAAYGAHVWDALMQAGADFGIQPFGVEAQRILRLEKKHIIVGQDTDALSDPYGADMAWTVKLDKGDFLGKPSLVRLQSQTPKERLVGFEMSNPSAVPGEGDQIVENGHLAGRVTSARYSPTLEKSIGLGWVNIEHARPGSQLNVRMNGSVASAVVVDKPFYDPEGQRLRM